MKGARLRLAICTLAWSVPLIAQTPSPASDEIVVTGARQRILDLTRLKKARAAFYKGRAESARTSTLYFELRPAPGVDLAGITLTLVDGDQRIAVPIDADHRFVLPIVPAGHWELTHNRGSSRIAVRALVISVGATEEDRPLGDLRLQCRAGWELAKANHSFVTRSGFSAMGGCSSSRVAFWFSTPHAIRVAVVTDGGKPRQMAIDARHGAYLAPIADRSLSNTATVHVRYN